MMNTFLSKGTNVAWLILMVATGIGWWLGHTNQSGSEVAKLTTAGVIIVSFIKVWVVGFQFMELKHAPWWLKHIYNAWVLIISFTLIIICIG